MAAGNWHWYSQGLARIMKGEIDLDSDSLKAILLDAGHTPDQAAHDDLADVSADEIADSGYARQTIANLAITVVSGQIRVNFDAIDFGDAVSLEGKYLVIFDDTHANDALVCFVDLNTASTSATVASTNDDFDINTAAVDELTITPTAYSAGN